MIYENIRSIHTRQYGINFSMKKITGLNIPMSATFSVINVIFVVINTVALLDIMISNGEISMMVR
jgi:hypothetical protein